MHPRWRIDLFGGLSAELCSEGPPSTITRFRTQKTASLLAYLAYFRRHRHARETLIERLWPDSEDGAGRHNLSVALSSLRQQLEPPGVPDGSVLVAERYLVGLDSAAIVTDVDEFEKAIRSAAPAASEGERVRC